MEVPVLAFQTAKGDIRYSPVPWDEQIFQFPCYELLCRKTELQAVEFGLESFLESLKSMDSPVLVHAKLCPSEIEMIKSLCGNGFYPIESSLSLRLQFAHLKLTHNEADDEFCLRPAVEDDLMQLKEIAGRAFWADRLHLDPQLPSDKADARMSRWIENSMRNGEGILVYENCQRSEIIGLFNYRAFGSRRMHVGLTAMSKEYQSSFAAVQMNELALVYCQNLGFAEATADVSINNLNSLRLALRFGFQIGEATATLHWFHRPKERQQSKTGLS